MIEEVRASNPPQVRARFLCVTRVRFCSLECAKDKGGRDEYGNDSADPIPESEDDDKTDYTSHWHLQKSCAAIAAGILTGSFLTSALVVIDLRLLGTIDLLQLPLLEVQTALALLFALDPQVDVPPLPAPAYSSRARRRYAVPQAARSCTRVFPPPTIARAAS